MRFLKHLVLFPMVQSSHCLVLTYLLLVLDVIEETHQDMAQDLRILRALARWGYFFVLHPNDNNKLGLDLPLMHCPLGPI